MDLISGPITWNAPYLIYQRGWVAWVYACRERASIIPTHCPPRQGPHPEEYTYDTIKKQLENKAQIHIESRNRCLDEATAIYDQLPESLKSAIDLAKQKGASSWLTVLPLIEHGFTLHRAVFHDAIALWYGWTPTNMATTCVCGKPFNVKHALSCARGGFPILRHNEVRDIIATLLTEVCHEVCVEPDLQPVAPGQLSGASANQQDGARLDVAANGVWGGDMKKLTWT